jgi:hypothetical protein
MGPTTLWTVIPRSVNPSSEPLVFISPLTYALSPELDKRSLAEFRELNPEMLG